MKADQQFVRTIEIKDRTGRVIGQKDVVTYQGLLSKAHEEGLRAIRTQLLQIPGEDNARTAIAKAIVETERGAYEALGDASPESVTSFLTPHLIRMAETRAKARALRDAVNIGVISFEELDGDGLEATGNADLGSGARGNGRSSPSPRGNGREGSGSPERFQPMTESQRRFLFRLLASDGLHQEDAHRHLLDRFQVLTLQDVSKEQASQFIDELQSRPRGNGSPHERGAPVQR